MEIYENKKEEVKKKINELKDKGIEYGKEIKLLEFLSGLKKEEIDRELINCENLEYCFKEVRDGEARYKLYFIYGNKRGRVYVITFREKIRLITIFPIGRNTLKKYSRKKFK